MEALFEACCDLSPAERHSYLDQACGDDDALRADVEKLLVGDATEDARLLNQVKQHAQDLAGDALATMQDITSHDPTTIGAYNIIQRLGAGGMGIVYLAEQTHPRRKVAVKVIRPGAMSAGLARRFEFEAQVLGQLRHPGIAHIYEAGTTAGDGQQPFFAMEYVDGVGLNRYVEKHTLDTQGILNLVACICDAVHHAHQQGVIHRDLKPGNILVEASGNPKILDFGVARAIDADIQRATMQTDVGQLVGTIPYMSPEQVGAQHSDIDTRSDVYALGVILYELLGKQLPHDMSQRMITEAARMIQEDEPPSLGALQSSCRGDVETIVAKAMEKDKTRRYQSANELADDLRRYLAYEPIVARKASAAYQLRKLARRHRGVAAGVVIAIVAMVSGTSVAVWQAFEARAAQQHSDRRLKDLHGFAKNVIFDYQRKRRAKGDTKAREFLTSTTLTYLDRMAQDTRGLDLDLLQDLALAYSEVGSVLGQPNGPNMGDTTGALACYEKAVALLEELVGRDPDNVEYQRSLAISLGRVGNLHLVEQHYDRALAVFQRSHDIKLGIADIDPRGQRNLSFSYNKLGDVYHKMGENDTAYSMYEESLGIRRTLADSNPDDDEAQRSYSVSLNRVGDALVEMGKITEALSLYEQSLQRRRQRAAAQPDNARATMDLAVGHFKVGHGLAQVERVDEAMTALGSSRNILLTMAKDDPGNRTAVQGAAEMSGEMGRLLLNAGRPDAALIELTACATEIEQASPEENRTATLRELLANTHHRRGQANLTLANANNTTDKAADDYRDAACAALRRSETLFRSLADDGSRVPQELLSELDTCPK
jgi:tetratricopeptide (TPR) repeat protein/predicted Ser/Thr protein kinase